MQTSQPLYILMQTLIALEFFCKLSQDSTAKSHLLCKLSNAKLSQLCKIIIQTFISLEELLCNPHGLDRLYYKSISLKRYL
jgi:hypothetical protein